MTIADRLTDINNTKLAIKASIEAKGQTVGSIPFSEYPSKIDAISGGGSSPVINEWVRPSDWLPITKPDGTSQKVIGLFAVFDNNYNYVSFTATGAYTVNWGDGSSSENYASGAQCQHKYTFASIDPATTTAEGYRQVVITITPQAGQNLSSINFQKNHTDVGSTALGKANWLELYASTSNADVLGGLSNFMTGKTMIPMLKAVYILPCNTVFDNRMGLTMFRGQAEWVEYVEVSRPNVVITSSGPFQFCRLIKKFNLHPTISATDCSNLFNGCVNLIEAPEINTVNSTNFSSMFSSCSSLQTVPLYDTSNGTGFTQMFYGCNALSSIPNIDTSKGSVFTGMFQGCSSLLACPPTINTSNGTNFISMFQSCTSLKLVPALDTSKATGINMRQMFRYCASIEYIPPLNTAAITIFSGMFESCTSLKYLPVTNTRNGTEFYSALYGQFIDGCSLLKEIPAIDCSKVTSFTNIFRNSLSLESFKATGISQSFSVVNANLSAAALNELYTNLPIVTGKTVTVTGNWGAAASDITIATAKGWTVTR